MSFYYIVCSDFEFISKYTTSHRINDSRDHDCTHTRVQCAAQKKSSGRSTGPKQRMCMVNANGTGNIDKKYETKADIERCIESEKKGYKTVIMNGGEDAGVEVALANFPSIHGQVSQAQDYLLQSYGLPQPR